MKSIKNLFILVGLLLFATSCRNSDPTPSKAKAAKPVLKQMFVNLGTHKLAAFSVIRNSKYLVVFEAGLGGGHSIWDNSNVELKIADSTDIVSYDRAGYEQSESGPGPRDINRLQSELGGIIDAFANGRKVVLVGHSLGGFIIRDWAIKNPNRVAGLLFIDPSSEAFDHPTQADQDAFYNSWLTAYGPTFAGTREADEWKNDCEYMTRLGNLPDVPVIVLTAMKVDASFNAYGRQMWYDAHELLGNGVTDFTNVGIPNSGHIVIVDQPQVLIKYMYVLLSKLP